MNFISKVDKFARSDPQAIFSTHQHTGHDLSYLEFAQLSKKLCTLFASMALKKGSRVALLTTNHWLLHPLLISCANQELVLVPINPELHHDEIVFILEDAAPSLIIAESTDNIDKRFKQIDQISLAKLLSDIKNLDPVVVQNDEINRDVVLIVYTSGTTGVGKGVMLSEQNLYSMATLFADFYKINTNDRFICVLPLHHINGIMITGLLPLVSGAFTLFADVFSFKNAKFYWDIVTKEQITICSLVPSIMAMLLHISPKDIPVDTGKVRHAFCGTAPLPADIWLAFERRFGFPVFQGYGLTETTTWVTCTPNRRDHRYDSVGVPIGSDIKLEPYSKKKRDIFEGEVLVKGSTVMIGYYNKDKLTDSLFNHEGYLKTGDLGFFDEDGELHISGRKKEIIIRNGININPIEVDEIIKQHPEIIECKTIGIEDPICGEAIVSVCVPANTQQPPKTNDIKNWVKEYKSEFYCPNKIYYMGYLPKGPTAKVKIKELRKIIIGEFVDEIFTKLSLRKYRRSQPSDAEGAKAIIKKAVFAGSPINLLSYWGCGKRDSITDVDKISIQRLKTLMDEAQLLDEVKCNLTLMLNDVHSIVNQIPTVHYQNYYSQIGEYAKEFGFTIIMQSEVWRKNNLNIEEINDKSNSKRFDNVWKNLYIKKRLIEQASKHFRGDSSEAGARNYAYACLTEADAIAQFYSEYIFLTYNGPEFDICLPTMPKLYIFSYKKGRTEKPWFM